MQNELDVDVSVRREKARKWARANGEPRVVFESPQPPWWHKYFTWERNLIVAGRSVEKGWVVPQPLGVALIVLMLGVVGWAYTSNTKDARDTRESIIRMETMLNERTQTFKEQQAELRQQFDTERRVAELQREKQRDEIRDMRASLPQKRRQ